jgi:hypothetical protein
MRSLVHLVPRALLLATIAAATLAPSLPSHAETGPSAPSPAGDATPSDSPTQNQPGAESTGADSPDARPADAGSPVAVAVEGALAVPAEAPAAAAAPARRALIAAIDAAFEREALRVKELQVRLAEAPDAMSALAIQRQIDAVKQQIEIDILELQLEHAQREQRGEDAQQLSSTLEKLRRPQALRRAVDRPAPVRN